MDRILDRIDGPADLKALSLEDLAQLAAEVRAELVETVSQTGGHLASNLGVVEISLSMHALFDSPRDKFVWDVGHQAYVHKLLTGRRERFGTIRQLGGLAGYTTRDESPHDPFGAAHAGTSISAALGMAVARDLAGDDYHVLAVIGDGALTCGMAYEAINQAGHLGTPLIVILNDNEMSISPNVGAIARSMSRLRLDRRYLRAKQEVEEVLNKLPRGGGVLEAAKRFKHAVKALVLPRIVWEELGFTYIGPIDGHDLRQVVGALALAKEYEARPTLIHALTVKGKGYEPSEADSIKYHGVSPAGGAKAAAPNYSKVFADATADLMRLDRRVVAVTAAMLEGTGLVSTQKAFPKRVFDVGISEQHAVTFAGGLATQALRPVVAIYSTFLQRGYDQIVHDICIQNLPVTFALDRAGVVGDDGKTHQGAFDVAYLRTLPNMVVSAPKDEAELRHLLYTAINSGRPFAVRFPRGAGVGVPLDEDLRELPIGRGELLRSGGDLAILAFGNTVTPALEAAEKLAEHNIAVSVINARFAKPLDEALILDTVARTRRAITVEEHALHGGFGSAVAELLAERRLAEVELEMLGLPDEFVEHGSQAHQRQLYDLDADGIVRRALASFDWPGHTLVPFRRGARSA